MTYEWDPVKAEAKFRKHGVTFVEAASVFLDPFALTFDDPDHSAKEDREITIGFSAKGRALFVSHGARETTRNERRQYAEEIERRGA